MLPYCHGCSYRVSLVTIPMATALCPDSRGALVLVLVWRLSVLTGGSEGEQAGAYKRN